MLYLLDTNAVRDAMDDNVAMAGRLAKITAADRVAVSSIVRGEILFGIERMPAGKRRDLVAQKAQAIFDEIDAEPVPVAAGDHYARVKRARELRGVPMDENDLWIAATALALNAVLVTRDSDFRDVTGLTVEDWTT